MGEKDDKFIEWLMENAVYICWRTWIFKLDMKAYSTSQMYYIYKEM